MIKSAFRLDGRRVLITGASSDIGMAIALACSEAGAAVALTGRNAVRLARAREAIGNGNGTIVVAADLTKAEERDRVADAAGPLDGVVHAAALTGPAMLRS